MPELSDIVADLTTEHDELDRVMAPLDDDGWDEPTPAEGWSIRDQITHLRFFDEQALLAVTDPDGFAQGLEAAAEDPLSFTDRPLEAARRQPIADVLAHWRSARAAMLDAFGGLDPAARIPWYGPPMSSKSFVTARLMETWAHGQDIVDTLGIDRTPTERIRHIAHLGVLSRPYTYQVRGMEMPDHPVAVELTGPNGDTWEWGQPGGDRVAGPALDFCLVVVRRRHVDDTALQVTGEIARQWMEIAQAYAGPPGSGRSPGEFAPGR